MAAAIIFKNSSTNISAIFGVVVAVYISFSEYWLMTNPGPKGPSEKILEAAMGMSD